MDEREDTGAGAVAGEAAPGPEAEGGDRRALLAELAKWAALGPALAVLVDPETAKASLSCIGQGC